MKAFSSKDLPENSQFYGTGFRACNSCEVIAKSDPDKFISSINAARHFKLPFPEDRLDLPVSSRHTSFLELTYLGSFFLEVINGMGFSYDEKNKLIEDHIHEELVLFCKELNSKFKNNTKNKKI